MKYSLSLQIWNPVPGKEKALAVTQAGDGQAGKQLSSEDPGGPCEQQGAGQPHTLASARASSILSSTNSRVASRLREVTITFCSALRPHQGTLFNSLTF